MARMRQCTVCWHLESNLMVTLCEECGSGLPDKCIEEEDSCQPNKHNVTRDAQSSDGEGCDSERSGCRATLHFPWGEVEIKDRLNIGRDPEFSPLWDKIKDDLDVSRRHAEIFRENGYVHLQHLGNSWRTYHNDTPIEKGKTVQLADGDTIRFSEHLTAKLKLG